MTHALAARMSRPRPVAFAVSLLLAWLLLALIAFALRRGPIRDDLASRATAAVRAAGGLHAQVHIVGREAVVTGRFPSAAAAEQARASAAVSGTTSARLGDDVVIATEPARPLVLAASAGALSVTATVPDRQTRDTLLAAVADAAGAGSSTTRSSGSTQARPSTSVEVHGQIAIDESVAEPPLEAVPALAAALRGVPGDHSVALRGATLELTGSVSDASAGRRLATATLDAARATVPGATLQDRVTVPSAASAASAGSGRAEGARGRSGSAGAGGTGRAAATGGAATGGAATGAASAAVEVPASVRAALGATGITFPVSAATLSPAARAGLDRVADTLRGNDLTVIVGGYTDATGSSTVNQALSLRRAEAVADYLVTRGVPRARLRAAGFGTEAPVGDNGTGTGRAANRRVQIMVSLTP
ncbi:OmpA-OmpF porin, OOP family [Frankia sp. AiPs1]|uniref:OmpA family protein n=1 Tax=Frankia sp. AiPa1 TaxID=573492 RepID=UPI00202B2BFE|nr:OmpA family protein [Frankia sp. AiPa1]MCL9759398.1 OmpA family protein [Frankia sp. AiPa1]